MKGGKTELLFSKLSLYRKEIYRQDNVDDIFYIDILIATIIIACKNSSWENLTRNSDISFAKWSIYLQKKSSIKMLWPAQRLIVEKGILKGKNAIVQLPTGVGKTKSIEIIIQAAFLSERAKTVIIVAPLNALCNEITNDMYHSFGEEVEVNQFSDVLQNDLSGLLLENLKKQILVCTPEKLSYVLHHDAEFLKSIDVFIFDEGHMFDAGGRGATYELLVTHIRRHITDKQQFILLSAVLPNSEEIKKWLFNDNGVLATDDKIVSTPKSVGFSSKNKDIYFFSDDKDKNDYYIPRVLKVVKLNRLPRERSDKFFPNIMNASDVAIYNAVKLCSNGGVAIYIGQQRSMKTIFNRILDLNKRNYDLSPLKEHTSQEELDKLKLFFEKYYGPECYYTKASELGILPHSSNIQNGVKLAVEYSIKQKYASCVVCTSTLAQGINMPIKYLLVTSVRVGRNRIKTRDFQNLIGRIARAGVYTEGSVIVTDSRIYDGRNDWMHGGKYLWDNCNKLFDVQYSEPCSSSILALVQEIKINHEKSISGEEFIKEIIDHLNEKDYFIMYAKKTYSNEFPNGGEDTITPEVILRQNIIAHIENYLCLVYSNEVLSEENDYDAIEICTNTLAYALANEKEKNLLQKVFAKIQENIQQYPLGKLRKYSNAMSGIEQSVKIEQWITDNKILESSFSEKELLESIVNLYGELNRTTQAEQDFRDICHLWLEGKTPYEISNEKDMDISVIDDICNKQLSYELNFLIGNIYDLIDASEGDDLELNIRNMLSILQKKIKYGVPSTTAISICEKIFNDRLLAISIARILIDENIAGDMIIQMIKLQKEYILEILNEYPGYFKDRMTFLLR